MEHFVVNFGEVVDWLVNWFVAMRGWFNLLITPFDELPQEMALYLVEVGELLDLSDFGLGVIQSFVNFVNGITTFLLGAVDLLDPTIAGFLLSLNTVTFLCYFSINIVVGVWVAKFIWGHIVG